MRPACSGKAKTSLPSEGTYKLWWGIYDLGIYGIKAKPGSTPRPRITAIPANWEKAQTNSSDEERFKPLNVMKSRQERFDGLDAPALIRKLEDSSVYVRDQAAKSLAKKGGDALPHLIKALEHQHWHVRRGTCDAIQRMDREVVASATDAMPAWSLRLKIANFTFETAPPRRSTPLEKCLKMPLKSSPPLSMTRTTGGHVSPQ